MGQKRDGSEKEAEEVEKKRDILKKKCHLPHWEEENSMNSSKSVHAQQIRREGRLKDEQIRSEHSPDLQLELKLNSKQKQNCLHQQKRKRKRRSKKKKKKRKTSVKVSAMQRCCLSGQMAAGYLSLQLDCVAEEEYWQCFVDGRHLMDWASHLDVM